LWIKIKRCRLIIQHYSAPLAAARHDIAVIDKCFFAGDSAFFARATGISEWDRPVSDD
jgi:hypothetical protein